MYLENDKYQHRYIEIKALFITQGMQRWGTLRHVLFLRVVFIGFIFFPFHVNKYVYKYFKHYYNDGHRLVIKYVFN